MTRKNLVLYRENKKPIVWDAFYNETGKPKPLVIFCHGYKGFKDWGSWNLVAETFKNEHFFFVKFNFSVTHKQSRGFNNLESVDL